LAVTNIFYDTKRSRVHLWETIEGERFYDRLEWVPYVYVPDENGDTKTIDGVNVRRKDFGTFQEYNEYQKGFKHHIYENEVPKEIQFLTEKSHVIPDEELDPPKLKIYALDIEVHSERGFPKVVDSAFPVVLINVREFGGGVNITWGVKPYTGDNPEGIEYIQCKSETDLLRRFFEWWHRNAPDVVTGWNIAPNSKMNQRGGFDLGYLVNRSKVLFGVKADEYKKLSPIGIVRAWEDQENGALYVDIAGVSVIDYFTLYKWYTRENPENYKLDTIARHELNLGKVDYSQYEDLRTLFHENWNMYVDYNAVDCRLIEQMEDKLGYILLAQSLTMICRCKMESYTSSTQLVEGLMLTHFRRNELCAPRMVGGDQEWFPAAFVKPPQRGQHDWIVDLDIASSYPTAIITLNMSPETYYGRVIAYQNSFGAWIDTISGRGDMDIEKVARLEVPLTEFVTERKFPPFKLMKDTGISVVDGEKLERFNMALDRGLVCVAPCGTMFMQNRKGAFAQVEQETYKKRQHINGMKKDAKMKAKRARNEEKIAEWNVIAEKHDALQQALKIVLNSAYGVTGVPYSRYFNVNIAEAITSCGRKAIIDGQKYVNRYFKEGVWNNDEVLEILSVLASGGRIDNESYTEWDDDFVAYIDTDSVFIRMGHFIDNVIGDAWQALDEELIIENILKLSKIVETYVNDSAYEETQVGAYNSRMAKEEFTIVFKQEIVCKSALFIQKKKYGYHVVNEEGVPTDEIDVTGLEIIRSETPAVFKEALREMLGMILRNASDGDIYEAYKEYRKQAREAFPEEVSENKGIKGIAKYVVDGEPIKGTPYHVKAAAAYHRLLKEMDIDDFYPEIEDDSKNKLVYVKPNPYNVKCIMYDRWPSEFTEAGVEPDYDRMIEKFLENKLKMLLEPMNREHILEQNQSFNIFFGG
jgi:DNA polymerase elongation subunit (family B)